MDTAKSSRHFGAEVDIWSDKLLPSHDLNKQIVILPQLDIQPG
jgi:hypothetical protein